MTNRVFAGVILLLLSAGWAANHFVSMIVVLRDQLGVSSVLLNGAFGIYAVGLLPGLLGGGVLADRIGARPVVLTGGVIAAVGNFSLLLWHEGSGLLVGRFIVGLGVGLAVSAGTAWAGRLRGASGITLAGIILTLGFAIGPIASGIFAHFLPDSLVTTAPFAISSILSLVAVIISAVLGDIRETPSPTATTPVPPAGGTGSAPGGGGGGGNNRASQRSLRKALAISIPMAVWVFSTATTSMVILSARASSHLDNAVLLPGIAAFLFFSAGLGAQTLGRKMQWGRTSGIIGALCAATGFLLAGLAGEVTPVWLFVLASLILGVAYGLSLREGLLGIEAYTPTAQRGTAIGIYYVFTYLGFGLPLLLDALHPTLGATTPLLIVAVLAVGSAAIRALQIKRGYLPAR